SHGTTAEGCLPGCRPDLFACAGYQHMSVWEAETHIWGIEWTSTGDIIAAGSTTGFFEPHGNDWQGLLVKTTRDGSLLWVKEFGESTGSSLDWDRFFDLVNGAGNTFWVVGTLKSLLPGETGPFTRGEILVQFDEDGNILRSNRWAEDFNGYGMQIMDMVASPEGELYVMGWVYGGFFPGNTLVGTQDWFVAAFDSSGETKWIHQWGTHTENEFDPDGAWAGAWHPDGYLVIGGSVGQSFEGADFSGAEDSFLAKVDPQTGDLYDFFSFGTDGYEIVKQIDIHADGDIIAFASMAKAYPGAELLTERMGMGVMRINLDTRTILWMRQFGAGSSSSPVACKVIGNTITISGIVDGDMVGPDPFTLTDFNHFTAGFTMQGEHLGTRQFKDGGDTFLNSNILYDGDAVLFTFGSGGFWEGSWNEGIDGYTFLFQFPAF
ncbi:hypothetical protein KJ865_16180, partial [Myxococcota bacterium]|nr:hypothetical protein [Myxococcota bacterium]